MAIAESISSGWKVLKSTITEFFEHDPFSLAATIAFYTLFSLPAILIIAVVVASTFFDQADVQQALSSQLGSLLGQNTANDIGEMLEKARVTDSQWWAKTLGILTLVFSATTVFVAMQSSINKIWRIKPKPRSEVLKYIINRLLSLAVVVCFGFLLLVSLILETLLAALNGYIEQVLTGAAVVFIFALNELISMAVITIVFAFIFKMLPDARVRWRSVWSGAVLTAVLFAIGKYLIGLYLGNSGVADTYGAAGSVVLVLLWVYYTVVLMLFGAQFTCILARKHGAGVKPLSHAVRVEIKETEVKSNMKSSNE